MTSVSMANVVPGGPTASSGFLFAGSLLQTSPSGPVSPGPVLSFSYTSTGALTLVQPTTPPTFGASNTSLSSLAVDATASMLFGPIQWSGSGIGAFLNAQGTLSPVPGSPFSLGSTTAQASVVRVHPSGKFVFTGNDDGSLTTFANSAGVLSNPSTTAPATASTNAIAVDPQGNFLFQSLALGTVVQSFSIDPTTGALTPIGPPANFGMGVGTIVLDGAGHLYAALLPSSGTTGAIGTASIGTSGSLSVIGQPVPFPNGQPSVLAFTP
jgi:hypothetical protein